MNTKKIKKILPKIALILALLAVLAVFMTGCASNTIIQDTDKAPDKWTTEEIELAPSAGFLDVILSWIGKFLNLITQIPPNSYIITLFIFGILLEFVMLPFGIKQQKNAIKQAMLRPKEMAIRKRYAGRNDQATQQKVTQEIQELYQKENYSPFSGCLPLLLQLPIIMVLYWLVVDPIQYVCGGSRELISVLYSYITASPDAGGLGEKLASTNGSIEIFSKIKELGVEAFAGIQDYCANGEAVYAEVQRIHDIPANFNVGPINLGLTPSFDFSTVNAWLLLIPVLTFAVYFTSMKINRKLTFQPAQNANASQQSCSNNVMDITMPLMSVWMTFIVPGAVGVYWMFKSVLGVIKQFIMSRVMPLPKFTEEDYKAAEREMNSRQPKKIVKSENAGKVRSLHHIDDDDYDEKGNYCPKAPELEVIQDEQSESDGKIKKNKKDKTDKTDRID